MTRAAELRSVAERTENADKGEALRKAADAYERMARWEPPEPIVGK